MDEQGNQHEIEAEGLLATCLQHEIDHLNGVLFIDYISKLKRDMVVKKFKKLAKDRPPTRMVVLSARSAPRTAAQGQLCEELILDLFDVAGAEHQRRAGIGQRFDEAPRRL